VAEEMLMWGWQGSGDDRKFMSHEDASKLLMNAKATFNLSEQSAGNFLNNELGLLSELEHQFVSVAEEQSKRLVAAHERFSSMMDKQRYQVVYPVLPMDLLGVYVLIPEVVR
jgi:hypothetical protein